MYAAKELKQIAALVLDLELTVPIASEPPLGHCLVAAAVGVVSVEVHGIAAPLVVEACSSVSTGPQRVPELAATVPIRVCVHAWSVRRVAGR